VLLILQGMAWGRADWLGHSLVARGRIENGTRQPAGYDSDTSLAELLPDSECGVCGRPFTRAFVEQVHCSTACAHAAARHEAWLAARGGWTEPPRCLWCRTLLEPNDPRERYCNEKCRRHAGILQQVEDADPHLGIRIRNARLAHRLTQEGLARRTGISHGHIANIDTGVMVMSDEVRAVLFEALHLDEDGSCVEPPPVRICPYCGEQIGADVHYTAKFCCDEHRIKFGSQMLAQQRLAKRRAAKGLTLDLGDRFCGYCGDRLADDANPTAKFCCPEHQRKFNTQLRTQRRREAANGHCDENVGFEPGPRPGPRPVRAGSAETRAP
jgi:hypothetical protein